MYVYQQLNTGGWPKKYLHASRTQCCREKAVIAAQKTKTKVQLITELPAPKFNTNVNIQCHERRTLQKAVIMRIGIPFQGTIPKWWMASVLSASLKVYCTQITYNDNVPCSMCCNLSKSIREAGTTLSYLKIW